MRKEKKFFCYCVVTKLIMLFIIIFKILYYNLLLFFWKILFYSFSFKLNICQSISINEMLINRCTNYKFWNFDQKSDLKWIKILNVCQIFLQGDLKKSFIELRKKNRNKCQADLFFLRIEISKH